MENFVDNPNSIKESDKINDNIKNDVEKLLNDNEIKKLLSSEPNNDSLKAKFFDLLPNINLLKGFEINYQKANQEERNFLWCLDDYVNLIKERQKQIENRLEKLRERGVSNSKKAHSSPFKIVGRFTKLVVEENESKRIRSSPNIRRGI